MAGAGQSAELDRLEAVLRQKLAAAPGPATDGARQRSSGGKHFPELDCVRPLLRRASARAAEQRADAIATGADRILIDSGVIDEELYVRALASSLNLPFETLEDLPRDCIPHVDSELIGAAKTGVLRVVRNGEPFYVVAPQRTAARGIIKLVEAGHHFADQLSLTTAERLQALAFRHAGAIIGARATQTLLTRWPRLSAGPQRPHLHLLALLGCMIVAALFIAAPGPTRVIVQLFFAAIFLSWILLRLAGLAVRGPDGAAPARLQNDELPIYTILVALYREAAALPGLVAALKKLDYPPEKLDVKFIVEVDDDVTRHAIARLRLARPFEVIVAPDVGPRTKPKALNVALPFARGEFLVIFDAEDRPERNQLRRALDAFFSSGDRLACVQARLTIDNTEDSWLAALFTAEYAGQFDVFLPAMAALQMPLPLGGSSNHFRTALLRKVGAWDPHNVTEDADLGMRLARFGYRTSVIEPSTYEEAPANFASWLPQRTRWFKGWMQTWLVHMRQPRRLLRELRFPGFAAFQLVVGGNVLSALMHPVFLFWFAYGIASHREDSAMTAIFVSAVALGYLTSALLSFVGLLRRGLAMHAWVLLLIPFHWLMLALAAWRALYQLVREPYRWEKTEHGLAKTSRRGQRPSPDAVVEEIMRQAGGREAQPA